MKVLVVVASLIGVSLCLPTYGGGGGGGGGKFSSHEWKIVISEK